eukprot:scaffold319692_cov19-Tisochrysis_lutea.AAC.1
MKKIELLHLGTYNVFEVFVQQSVIKLNIQLYSPCCPSSLIGNRYGSVMSSQSGELQQPEPSSRRQQPLAFRHHLHD